MTENPPNHLQPAATWDREAAARYETPGAGMFAETVVRPAVDMLARLAGGGRALEFAVGTGRLAIPLAQRGVPVAGIDYSPAMVDVLRRKINAEALPVTVGDMSSTRVDGEFTLVYLVFNTISNLLTQDAQVACFRNAAAHLAPGGRFVVELEVPRLRDLSQGQEAVVFAHGPGYVGLDIYDIERQHLTSYHFTYEDDGSARLNRGDFRYAWPAELDLMARLAGLTLEARYADWTGAPFTANSRGHVSVYRKVE